MPMQDTFPKYDPEFTLIHKFRNLDILSRHRTGDVITNDGCITSLLTNLDVELDNYDRHIAYLQSIILGMKNERTELVNLAGKSKSLLSPIRRLPQDVLSEIFTACEPRVEIDRSMKYSASALGSVCLKWREAMQANPSLWSSITLVVSPSLDVHKQVNLVRRALEKSMSLLLTLKIIGDMQELYPDSELQNGHPAIDELIRHAHRWVSLDIVLPIAVTQVYFRGAKGKLASLKSLTVWRQPGGLSNPNPPVLDVFWGASIRKLLLPPPLLDGRAMTTGGKYCLTLADLLEFISGHYPSGSLLCGLSLCPKIQTLNVLQCSYQAVPSDNANANSVEMKHLEKFSFMFFNNSNYEAFSHLCRSLSLPLLQHLTLTSDHEHALEGDHSWTSDLIQLLDRSQCHLTSLTLIKVSIRKSTLIRLLRVISTLTDLTVHEQMVISAPSAIIDNELLELLNIGSALQDSLSSTAILPKLQRVNLKASGSFTDKAFVNMISSRWRGNPYRMHSRPFAEAAIRSVQLEVVKRDVKDADYEPLKALGRMGLFVSVVSSDGRVVI